MTQVLFGIIIVSDFLLILVIAVSILFPKLRMWPPPKKNSWKQWVSLTLFTITMFGVPLIGILDLESIGDGNWFSFSVGGLAVLIGLEIGIWGTITLTAKQSLGEIGKIVIDGPYRYTRNPQYTGFILMYAGIILVTYSFMALVTGTFVIILLFITPFSEEPWLRQQYGKPYEEYFKKVPRFIGLRSFKTREFARIRQSLFLP